MPERVIEKLLHLDRGFDVQRHADNISNPLLALGNFLLEREGKLRSPRGVDTQPAVHRFEHRPEEFLLEVMDLPEFHCVDCSLLRVIHFKGDNGVFAVVGPELVFPGFRIPLLPLVFPVEMVLAVHRGEEVEAFREVGEQHMLREHCVPAESGQEMPMPPDVLRVVEEVLADDLTIRMG